MYKLIIEIDGNGDPRHTNVFVEETMKNGVVRHVVRYLQGVKIQADVKELQVDCQVAFPESTNLATIASLQEAKALIKKIPWIHIGRSED